MRAAFTLIEVSVVVLVLGVLAGIATPKFFDVSDKARDNSVMQCLSVVREAIKLYSGRNGKLPGADGSQATFKSDLAPYLRSFPVLAAGDSGAQDDQVVMDSRSIPPKGDNIPTEGWRYYYNLGVIIVNYKAPMASNPSLEYDDL